MQQQIDQWAQELKGLRDAAAIRRFRGRFDKTTAQRIIRSSVLSELDRGAISLTLNFSGASRYGYGDSCWFNPEQEWGADWDDGSFGIPSVPTNSAASNGR